MEKAFASSDWNNISKARLEEVAQLISAPADQTIRCVDYLIKKMKTKETNAHIALKLYHGISTDEEVSVPSPKACMNYNSEPLPIEAGSKVGFSIYDAYRMVKFNQFATDSLEEKIQRSLSQEKHENLDPPSSLFLFKSFVNHSCLANCYSQDLHEHSYLVALEDI